MRIIRCIKKALSPAVTIALLMIVTLSIGILLYAWYSGAIGRVLIKPYGAGSGVLIIDAVQLMYSKSTGKLTVKLYLRNVGGESVTIVRVYIKYAGGNPTYLLRTQEALGVGESRILELTTILTRAPPYGKYVITVVTLGGNMASTTTMIMFT